MEILKSISKNKLIVMVTHNPELAEEYSSRIIRVLDGQVTEDTNPYRAGEPEAIAAEPAEQIYSKENLDSVIEQTRKAMQEAAKKLEFIEAAQLRDKLIELEKLKNAK
jgi:excinuclease UvrABC helicase subunit UvrB